MRQKVEVIDIWLCDCGQVHAMWERPDGKIERASSPLQNVISFLVTYGEIERAPEDMHASPLRRVATSN